MKTIYCSLSLISMLLFGSTISMNAQSYSFSKSTGTYTDLVGATSVNNGQVWDDPQFAIPLGFNFTFYNTTVSTIYIDDYFWGGVFGFNGAQTGTHPAFMAFDADLIDRASGTFGPSLSPISTQLTGSAGSRIRKVEFKNAGFYEDVNDNGVSVDFLNFQVWFYETSNKIEVHFGPNSVTQPALVYYGMSGAIVGTGSSYNYSAFDFTGNLSLLSGPANNPTLSTVPASSPTFINGTPSPGTIYTFSRTVTSLQDESVAEQKITLYPNPAIDHINLNKAVKEDTQIDIINMLGQSVISLNDAQSNSTINISSLNPGVYLLQLTGKDGRKAVKQFIKE